MQAGMTRASLPITQMSGYRTMWMLTMFDLPVIRKTERKEVACPL